MKENMKKFLVSICSFGIETGFYISIGTLLFITKIPLYYQAFGMCFSIIFWGILCLINQKIVYKHYPWHWTELLLCSWIWIGLLWSVEPRQTILYGLIFTSGCLLEIFIASTIVKKKQVFRLLFFLFAILAIYAIYNISQQWNNLLPLLKTTTIWRSQLEVQGTQIEFYSTIGGRNSIGGIYALVFPLALSITVFGFRNFYTVKNFILKTIFTIVFGCFTALFFAMVLFSGSRGSFIGMIAGSIFLVLSYCEWQWSIIAGFVAAFSWFFQPTRKWFSQVFLETISGDISRITIWQNSVELWKLLWVTGTGLGTFQTVYTQFFLPAGEKEFIHAHNIFLNVGIELGLVGLLLFVVLGFQFIYYGVFLGRQKWRENSFLGSINIGLAALVFGYLIRCLFDYTI